MNDAGKTHQPLLQKFDLLGDDQKLLLSLWILGFEEHGIDPKIVDRICKRLPAGDAQFLLTTLASGAISQAAVEIALDDDEILQTMVVEVGRLIRGQ